jgi:sugar O-acyltransferase (sialic acid O-acetyltransferase NeuD family)
LPDNTEELAIFGAGTLARLAHGYFARDTAFHVAAYTVHRNHLDAGRLDGMPVVPFDEFVDLYPPSKCSIFVAVGYKRVNRLRAEIFEECRGLGYSMPALVSSRAHCWPDLKIGQNCLVFDGTVIEPNVELGDDVIVWSGTQLSHDVSIGDHCFLGPNAVVLGDVVIGARSFIGGNATVHNGVTIAPDCVIGAGTVIKKNTSPGDIYSVEHTRARKDQRSGEIDL